MFSLQGHMINMLLVCIGLHVIETTQVSRKSRSWTSDSIPQGV